MKYFLIYLLCVNLIGFLFMFWDKQNAIHDRRRISEMQLFRIAFLLGSPGIICGMYTFRHKTKHKHFTIGMPAIFIAETALILFVYFKFIA